MKERVRMQDTNLSHFLIVLPPSLLPSLVPNSAGCAAIRETALRMADASSFLVMVTLYRREGGRKRGRGDS